MQQQPAPNPSAYWYWLTGVAINAPLSCDDSPCSCCPGENGDQDYIHFGGGTVDILGDVGTNPQQCSTDRFPALIEWSADCNGDGIVDYGQCRDGSLPDYDGDNVPDCCEAGTPCTVDHYPVQWRVEEGGNGHWYQWIGSSVTRDAARATAVSSGGDLASIASAAENDFIKIVVQGVNAWIGGYQAAGSCEPGCGWRWLDGSEWSYSNWDPESGEPNDGGGGQTGEQGLEFRSTGRWNDYWTWRELPYVNEWSADCDTDGVVDYGQILRGEVADVNGNGIPDTCDCPADINQSGTVDAEDLAYVLFAWGMPGGKAGGADINGDATVDANDLSLVLGSWGPCPN